MTTSARFYSGTGSNAHFSQVSEFPDWSYIKHV